MGCSHARPTSPAPSRHPAPAANLDSCSAVPPPIFICCRLDLAPWPGWAPPGQATAPGPLMPAKSAPTYPGPPAAPQPETLGGMWGPQHPAVTLGRGGQDEGGGAAAFLVSGPAQHLPVVTAPRSAVWPTHVGGRGQPPLLGPAPVPTPSVATAAEAATSAGSGRRGKGSFFLPFSLFSSIANQKRKKKKKERKKLLRDSFELFAKSAFYHHTEKAPLPAPGEQISSSFSGPARLQLSPRPRDRPGHRRGEKLLVLLVHQAALPYLPLDPPCWLGWGFEKMGGTSGSLCQSRGWGAVCVGGEAVMGCPGYPGLSLGQSPPARQTPQVGLTPSSHLSPAGGNCQLLC